MAEPGGLVAGAEAVGDAVLLQQAGEALDFALVGGGEEDAGFLLDEGLERRRSGRGWSRGSAWWGGCANSTSERSERSASRMSTAPSWSSSHAGEVAEAVVEVPGGEVDVFGADEVADAGAVVALLDLVPPALALVLDHGGLFDEDAGVRGRGGRAGMWWRRRRGRRTPSRGRWWPRRCGWLTWVWSSAGSRRLRAARRLRCRRG